VTQIITDLGLWLAVHEPHCCALSESVAGQRLSAAPLAIQDTKFTAGVRGTDGIAVLSSAEGRLSARGHGPAGERLAGRAGVSRSTCIRCPV
jgi:hypothetical protein